jgi:transcriptional regulator with XRE-family HTH domain
MRPGTPNRALIGLRTELGLSQEQYAELVGAEVRSVRGWETGEVACPQARHLAKLYTLHGVDSPEQLGFEPRRSARSTATVGHTDSPEADVLRRDILGMAAAAAFTSAVATPAARLLAPLLRSRNVAVGRSDVARVEQTNQTFYDVDFLIGGGALRSDVLVGQFRKSAGLLQGTFQEGATRQAMHSAVAHLGSTIGFMLFDQGQHQDARKVYLASLQVAQDASDMWPLRAIILSELARQCLHLGEFGDALELLRIAHGADDEITPTAKAMLHGVRARVHAGQGNVEATDRYVGMAEEEFARSASADDPSWITWFDHAELHGEAGHAYYALALNRKQRAAQAAQRLTLAIQNHGPDQVRSKALVLTKLSKVRMVQDEPGAAEDGAAIALQSLDLYDRLQSPRVREDLVSLRPLVRPHRHLPALAELDGQLAVLGAGNS